ARKQAAVDFFKLQNDFKDGQKLLIPEVRQRLGMPALSKKVRKALNKENKENAAKLEAFTATLLADPQAQQSIRVFRSGCSGLVACGKCRSCLVAKARANGAEKATAQASVSSASAIVSDIQSSTVAIAPAVAANASAVNPCLSV